MRHGHFLAADIVVEGLERKRESWLKEHEQVMQDYAKADCLGEIAGLMLYAIDCLDKAGPPREKLHLMTVSWSANLCEHYKRWYNFAASVAADIDQSEDNDFPVVHSDDFRDALRRVGQMLPEMKHHKQRLDDIRAGKCVPLKDALNGMGSLSSGRDRGAA